MKPKVFRTCHNPDCAQCGKEVALQEEEGKWFFLSPYCDACHHEGKLRLVHKDIAAESSEAFYAKVGGMAKEFHLLKKLVTKGVAESEDIERYQQILEQIKDLQCTGCGQRLIEHEH